MKYERFEQVPVWQAGMTLTERVFTLTEDKSFSYKGDLRSQLQRAALSVPNNVAEGFERGTTQELITFLYIARGSAGEVRSMLCLAERLPYFAHLKSEISVGVLKYPGRGDPPGRPRAAGCISTDEPAARPYQQQAKR